MSSLDKANIQKLKLPVPNTRAKPTSSAKSHNLVDFDSGYPTSPVPQARDRRAKDDDEDIITEQENNESNDDGQFHDEMSAEELAINTFGSALMASMRSSGLRLPKVDATDLVDLAQPALQAPFQQSPPTLSLGSLSEKAVWEMC